MKIAFISDVHGNLAALKTAVDIFKDREVDLIVSLGDLVHYGPMPEEVISFIQKSDIECVQGNCDRTVARNRKSTGEEYENPHWRNLAADFLTWTSEQLSVSQKRWLRELPDELRFQVGKKTILCVHGLPGNQAAGLPEDAAAVVYDAILSRSDSSIVVCGFTHTPSIIRRPNGLIINPGSVGGGTVPSGGTGMILTFPDEGEPEVETLEYTYPIREIENGYEAAGIGDIFLKCLELGRDQRGNWHTDDPKWRQQWAEL
ncbi:MAG: metallophosphoesterase family protein [Candidatus Sabulitectum sp.]|nr:metallophosphoesterase family protein [Candidatus Sabulitectum sp.]